MLRHSQWFFASLWILATGSAHAIELPPAYLSGPEVCKKNLSDIEQKQGQTLWVPIDYQDPKRGKTPLYFWLKAPLNPSLPTLIYVTGGPGSSAHRREFAGPLPKFNVIYFDQRGIDCSKPLSRDLYLDPSFYSSENTAHDIEQIRTHLGVERFSVYGHSYGTVPATLYGSLYPQSTRAILLEGIVFEGGTSLYQNSYLKNLMQKAFDQLRPEIQEKVIAYSRDPRVSPYWYSRMMKFMMYLNNSLDLATEYLERVFSSDSDSNIISYLNFFSSQPLSDPGFGSSLVNFAMISCKELGQAEPYASFYYVFNQNRRLISDPANAQSQNQLCLDLHLSTAKIYSAANLKITAPVTYFQGEYDGATAMPGAQLHFKNVPHGFAQLLIGKKGGHTPNLVNLLEYKEGDLVGQLQREIFSEAVMGNPLSPELLAQFNSISDLKWDYLSLPRN